MMAYFSGDATFENTEMFHLLKIALNRNFKDGKWNKINPNIVKAGGLQSQGVKGDAVVCYLESLTTQDLKCSDFPCGETTWQNRHHPSWPVVARRVKSDEFTKWDIQKMVLSLRYWI